MRSLSRYRTTLQVKLLQNDVRKILTKNETLWLQCPHRRAQSAGLRVKERNVVEEQQQTDHRIAVLVPPVVPKPDADTQAVQEQQNDQYYNKPHGFCNYRCNGSTIKAQCRKPKTPFN